MNSTSGSEKETELRNRIAELEAKLAEREKQHNLMIRSLFHDIKNPLSVTLGSLQVARMVGGKHLPAKALRLLDSAEDGGNQQLAMIQNLADQIKIEMGELTLDQESFIPGPIVSRAFAHFTDNDSQKSFIFDNNAGDQPALGDPTAFEKAVRNILEHCLKHTHHGAHVIGEADIVDEGYIWKITFSDDGETIGEDHTELIFDRLKGANTKNLGARRDIGLGLSYARSVLRAMGGELTAAPRTGGGTRLVLTLRRPD